jgi:hypothetical protein
MHERIKLIAPIVDHVMQTSAPDTWPTYDGKMLDRTRYVTSSEAGFCIRRIWFSKNITLPEGKVKWGFFERGHSHEAWLVSKLHQADCELKFKFVGDEQVSFYAGYQSGTPDGVAYNYETNETILLEFKSIDPRTKVSALPKKEHVLQTIQNMDLVEECLDIVFDYAVIAYFDASDYSMVYEFMIDRSNPKVGDVMVALEARAERVMKATSADELEAEGMYNGGCKYCPFTSQCSASVTATKQEKQNYDRIGKTSNAVFG